MGSMVWDLGIGISNGCRSLVLESAISAVYLPFCFVVSTISTIVSAVSAHFGNIGIGPDKVYGDISNHDGKFSAQIECSVSLISSPGWIRMGLAMRKNRHCMIFQTILPLAKNHISCIIQWYRKKWNHTRALCVSKTTMQLFLVPLLSLDNGSNTTKIVHSIQGYNNNTANAKSSRNQIEIAFERYACTLIISTKWFANVAQKCQILFKN